MPAANRSGAARFCIVAPEEFSADVAVVGGGPAGSAAALTLLRYSNLSVAVIERSAYTTFRIGECLTPGATELLQYLGAAGVLARTESLASQAVAAAWGSSRTHFQDFIFTGRGPGWHVDRRRFDGALARLVEDSGGHLSLDATVEDARRNTEGKWRLQIRQGDGRQRTSLTAKYLIDSTGKQAVIARHLGARIIPKDHLVGISGLYEFHRAVEGARTTLVEAVPSGWWYTAGLPGAPKVPQMIAVFMTDADIARRCRCREAAQWKRNLARTEHTRLRLNGGKFIGPLRLHAAHSGILNPVSGPGWIAAGDAAVSFDPLASMGIGYALLSGIEAGRVAHNVLTGSGKLASAYAESVDRHFRCYLELRAVFYQQEQRWHKQPFWHRRCESRRANQ
jgi:flavin-dependent dehydrogenase